LIAELTAVDVGWNAELTWLLAPPPITASSSIETRERRASFWKLRVFMVICPCLVMPPCAALMPSTFRRPVDVVSTDGDERAHQLVGSSSSLRGVRG
jgi:hypothetical protein